MTFDSSNFLTALHQRLGVYIDMNGVASDAKAVCRRRRQRARDVVARNKCAVY
jgi:hypothetical protein